MKLKGIHKLIAASSSIALAFLVCSFSAFAQEVTYYNFDVPQSTPSQTSYQCPSSGAPSGVLLCFNSVIQGNGNPSYFSDTYPANINPGGTNPNYAVQFTPAITYQAISTWFGVPQQVSSGFTAYFAFRITPNPASYATADGIAFVLQNSQTGGSSTQSDGSTCTSTGTGANIVGGVGGCMGYGGIDNSLAIEFDTYRNNWDPDDLGQSQNDNHVAIQNCGAGAPNAPDHTGSCLVQLSVGDVLAGAINSAPGITFADGNVHQVVINYSGPNEATPNLLQVFIDPTFNSGTHTPVAGSVPALSGTYNIASNLNLANGTSAYVGFTSATGSADEQHEVLAWTYTPHTTVTQQQPLNPPTVPTPFPFGGHTYTVTYPATGPTTSGFNMVVTANTISPSFFQSLVSGGPFQGSVCQVYDETGGNCVVYSVSCNQSGTPVACPSVSPSDTNPADLIAVQSVFNNSTPLVTPGFLQGDPLYSLLTSITGDGTTATVTCAGECSVTVGQTVTVAGSSVAGFNGTVTVESAPEPNIFTYASTATASPTSPSTGGYITSTNVQNIITGYNDSLVIDSGVSGKTKNFSDFIVTSVTPSPTGLAVVAPAATYGQPQSVTVTATSANGNPTGNITLTVDSDPTVYTQALTPVSGGTSGSSATFSLTGLTGGQHTLSISYATTGVFLGSTTTANINIGQATPTVALTGVPASAVYNSSFIVGSTTTASTTAAYAVSGVCTISGTTVTITRGSGTCTVSANWNADTNYLAALTSSQAIAVKANSTTSVISDTPNPTTIQSPVSLVFSVTGNGSPTGTYTVASSLAGDPSCSGSLPASPCSLTFQTPGTRTLTITYAGDGNFNGSSTTVQQAVSTTPIASISPGSLNFGTLYVGGAGLQSVTVTNVGDAAMTISDPVLFDVGNGDSKEFVALNLCPRSLAAGKSCTIYVAFLAGPSYNTQTAILKIVDNAPNSPQSVPLTAMVINPQATFKPGTLGFGAIKVGTPSETTVQMTNTGTTPLTVSGFAIKGTNATDFTQTNNCPATLNAGASCSIFVTFDPAKTGARSATLSVTDNVQSGSSQLSLSGTGK
jgi:hypothetical protein